MNKYRNRHPAINWGGAEKYILYSIYSMYSMYTAYSLQMFAAATNYRARVPKATVNQRIFRERQNVVFIECYQKNQFGGRLMARDDTCCSIWVITTVRAFCHILWRRHVSFLSKIPSHSLLWSTHISETRKAAARWSTKPKEYEILRSPGSGASLLKMGQVDNYCAMRGICLLNRAISPTFLPLYWT